MIQEKIDRLLPYFKGLVVSDSYRIVEVLLKKKWSFELKEGVEYTQKETKDSNIQHILFYSSTKTFDDIIDYIETDVIEYNLEVEEKERLLKAKVEELKRVFETKSLDELNHLKFTTDEDQLTLKHKTSQVVNNEKVEQTS